MFCRKCGKEIGEAKFCPFCGEGTEVEAKSNFDVRDGIQAFREKVRIFGHEKISNLISFICAVISVLIRIKENEIEVVYNVLAQDDYFVLSEQGRSWMIWVIVIQVLLCGVVLYDANKAKIEISKATVVFTIGMLAVQILAMLLRIPAPY